MGIILTNEDPEVDETFWNVSAHECQRCGDPIRYADECILLKCTFPVMQANEMGHTWPDLPNPETEGLEPVAPVIFESDCWEDYAEDLRSYVIDRLGIRPEPAIPSSFMCTFCRTSIGWGTYCGHIICGELGISGVDQSVEFKPNPNENIQNAELICMDCLAWINEECDEDIWSHLWGA